MKSIILSSIVTALLLFTGCADKEPVIDDGSTNQQAVQEVENVQTETVSSEDSMMNSNGTSMSMSDIENQLPAIYFAFDRFSISTDMKSGISTGVSIANDAGSNFNVKLEGNCDEWGSDEYNFALGLKRANAVKKALIVLVIFRSIFTIFQEKAFVAYPLNILGQRSCTASSISGSTVTT